jgi:hypothetical protein
MTNLFTFIINVQKSHHQPQCTLQLMGEYHILFAWVAKYTEVDGGIFKHLLWTVTNLSFPCKKSVI